MAWVTSSRPSRDVGVGLGHDDRGSAAVAAETLGHLHTAEALKSRDRRADVLNVNPKIAQVPGRIVVSAAIVALAVVVAGRADAAEAPVGLGAAASFAVLGASTVTNTGPSVLTGDLGLTPGSSITGFPPGVVVGGSTHIADAQANQAQAAAATAYDDAASRASTATVTADLGGQTLNPGVYTSGGGLAVTGTLTLDAQGSADSVFIFQAGTTVVAATNSRVSLINGANPCNVFWKVGSSATIGVGSSFIGTVDALESISALTDATVNGRLLARTGAVTLDTNRVSISSCASGTPGSTTTTTAAPPAPTTTTTAAQPTPTTTTTAAPPTPTTTTTSAAPLLSTTTTLGATSPLAAAQGASSSDVQRGATNTTTARVTTPATNLTTTSMDTGELPHTGVSPKFRVVTMAGLILLVLGALLLHSARLANR